MAVKGRPLGLCGREAGFGGGHRMRGTTGRGMWGSEDCCAEDSSTCRRAGAREALPREETAVGDQPRKLAEASNTYHLRFALSAGLCGTRSLRRLRTKLRAPSPGTTRPRHHLCTGVVLPGPWHAGRCSPDVSGQSQGLVRDGSELKQCRSASGHLPHSENTVDSICVELGVT